MVALPPMQGTLMTVSYRDGGTGTFVLIEDIEDIRGKVRDACDEDHWFEFRAFDGETYFLDVASVVVWALEAVNLADPGLPSTRSRAGVNRSRKKTRRLLEGDTHEDASH